MVSLRSCALRERSQRMAATAAATRIRTVSSFIPSAYGRSSAIPPVSVPGVTPDLFTAAAEAEMDAVAPLAERCRPTRLVDVVGQRHLVAPGSPIARMVETNRVGSMILYGPAGTGKTSLARVVAAGVDAHFVAASAVSATVKDIRSIADEALRRRGEHGRSTLLFLDEIHRFTRTQQDALLPHVESGVLTLIGATTESPWATVVGPLLSRCVVFELRPLSADDLRGLVARGADLLEARLDDGAVEALLDASGGDARRVLVTLELAATIATAAIGVEDVDAAIGAGVRHYDTGDHYDAASAYIKHMRAGDEMQALAWLRRMLDGGEDPMFIARRLVIFASEDIGHADATALTLCVAALEAVRHVGLPEATYALAHATAAMARAPKSRDVGDRYAAAADVAPVEPPTR